MTNPLISAITNLTSGYIAGEEREFYYSSIIAEFKNGARYQLRNSEIEHAYENSYGFYQQRDIAEVDKKQHKRITKINKHLAAGGSLNMDHWFELMPRYGSEAYNNRSNLDELLNKAYGE